MNTILFSVIIPCYNARLHIHHALTSLSKQTFVNFEVICVDDCSQDGTYEFICSLKNTFSYPLRVYRNDVNKGPGITRRRALELSKGEYICFCDSDDWFEPEALHLLSIQFAQNNSDLCLFDVYKCFKDGKRRNLFLLKYFHERFDKEDYLACCPSSLCSLSVRRNIIMQVDFSHSYNCEDGPVAVAIVKKSNSISFIKAPLYNYFYRNNSLSTTANQRVVDGFLYAYNYLLTLQDGTLTDGIEFQLIKVLLYGYVLNALKLGTDMMTINSHLSAFYSTHSNWYNNKYISTLPAWKRLWLYSLRHDSFLYLKLYVRLMKSYHIVRRYL